MSRLHVSPLGESGFRLAGDIDMASVGDLEAALCAWDGRASLVLDMADVSFMDSTGLRLLLKLCLNSRQRPAVTVLNPSLPIRRLLALSLPGGIPELAIRFEGDGPD